MGTQVRTYRELAEFETAVRPFLEAHEVENSLILGLVARYQTQPPDAPLWMAAVFTDDEPRLVGFFSGIQVILSTGDLEALPELIEELERSEIPVPGVVGPKELADAFAQDRISRHGATLATSVELRMYEVRSVIPPARVDGQMRVAGVDDLDLVVQWSVDFHDEAQHGQPLDREAVRKNQLSKIEAGWTYLWEVDGRPACIAAIGRPTRNGFSVGPVYTPVEFRNRGYASGLVAGVSQAVLDSGKEYVVLYTDLANPTANSIYQKIGYRPLGDSSNHWFATA